MILLPEILPTFERHSCRRFPKWPVYYSEGMEWGHYHLKSDGEAYLCRHDVTIQRTLPKCPTCGGSRLVQIRTMYDVPMNRPTSPYQCDECFMREASKSHGLPLLGEDK